jgi:S1-C subfamily serine protease
MKMTIIAGAIIGALVGLVAFNAYSADNKLQDVLAATPQLNKNCSAQVIKSDRDEKTGKVETIILTAKHCVSGQDKSEQIVEFPIYDKTKLVAKKEYIGMVKGQHFGSDLAIIELKDHNTLFEKVVKLAPAELDAKIGDPVVTVGYPLGMSLTVTNGAFGSTEVIDWPEAGTEFYRASPMIAGGNSGGGLYLIDKGGNYTLAGVATGVASPVGMGHIGFYTPSYKIQEYLKVAVPSVAEKVEEVKKVQ